MIDRGDLSVETSIDHVSLYQKRIIAAARQHGRPVIVATELLHSMIEPAADQGRDRRRHECGDRRRIGRHAVRRDRHRQVSGGSGGEAAQHRHACGSPSACVAHGGGRVCRRAERSASRDACADAHAADLEGRRVVAHRLRGSARVDGPGAAACRGRQGCGARAQLELAAGHDGGIPAGPRSGGGRRRHRRAEVTVGAAGFRATTSCSSCWPPATMHKRR